MEEPKGGRAGEGALAEVALDGRKVLLGGGRRGALSAEGVVERGARDLQQLLEGPELERGEDGRREGVRLEGRLDDQAAAGAAEARHEEVQAQVREAVEEREVGGLERRGDALVHEARHRGRGLLAQARLDALRRLAREPGERDDRGALARDEPHEGAEGGLEQGGVGDEEDELGVGLGGLQGAGGGLQRDVEGEGAAAADGGVAADLAVHQLHQLLADRQAQAGAAHVARHRVVDAVERREEVRDVVRRNALPSIAHRKRNP